MCDLLWSDPQPQVSSHPPNISSVFFFFFWSVCPVELHSVCFYFSLRINLSTSLSFAVLCRMAGQSASEEWVVSSGQMWRSASWNRISWTSLCVVMRSKLRAMRSLTQGSASPCSQHPTTGMYSCWLTCVESAVTKAVHFNCCVLYSAFPQWSDGKQRSLYPPQGIRPQARISPVHCCGQYLVL